MSIFMMVMIGGGIIFIDDKARGLHEGYLVTPITKLELVAGFNISGTIKAVLAGAVIMVIGSLIAVSRTRSIRCAHARCCWWSASRRSR
jgi:ABC-2 type transport system permease protein